MNNAVFGKTMENMKKRRDRKIIRSDERGKIANCLQALCLRGARNSQTTLQVSASAEIGWSWTSRFRWGWQSSKIEKSWCMILLQNAQNAVRRKVGTHLPQYGQSFAGDSNWRCLRGYGRQQTFVWHKRFSQRSSTSQRGKQKGFGQDERRDERNTSCWVCLPSAKNVLNPGREAKHQKVERHEKVCCEKRDKACALQRDAFLQKNTNWTCFTSKGKRFMVCGWTKSLLAHLIQSDISQKTE